MTLAPMYEAIKCETSEKPFNEEKNLLSFWALAISVRIPSIKRIICESVEMFY